MKTLAIIPARGGSKSIPSKNITLVGGKPLLDWTVSAARAALSIDRVIVSTDSPAIAEVARAYGAEVPFLRPAELAQDDTPGIAPILHAAQWLKERQSYVPDYVMCLQPTSPLRTFEDIEAVLQMARERQAEAVISVTPVDQHPRWMKTISEDGILHDYATSASPVTRRQDLPPVYALNGAIYLIRFDLLMQNQSLYADQTLAYIMPAERSLDIDTPWELYLADLVLKDKIECK